MSHVSKDAAALRTSREAGGGTLACELADAAIEGRSIERHVEEARQERLHEQQTADRNTEFAALGRQIGDAAQVGRSIAPLVQRLVALRKEMLGAPITEAERDRLFHHDAGRTIGR